MDFYQMKILELEIAWSEIFIQPDNFQELLQLMFKDKTLMYVTNLAKTLTNI